jgi:heme-degrading monooxygenase HmoA
MFLFYAIHYPKPEKEELLIQSMYQFGELIQKQPGIIFVNLSPFRDPEKGTLIGLAIWESQEAFQASWPVVVKDAPSEEWEVKPREVRMFNTVV